MALNSNYGYPGYSSPYSSTPTGIRPQRPRFGYSGPSMYPRSRSSATDINTESFSDSMINNYGTSTSRIDTTFNSENRNSYNDSYNTSNSNYYSANSSFSHGQSYGETSMMHNDFSLRENAGLTRDNSMVYKDQNMMRGYSASYVGNRAFPHSDIPDSGLLSKPVSLFDSSKYNYNFGMSNAGEFKGNFQKNSTFGLINKKTFSRRKQGKPKMAAPQQSPWRCDICTLDFTSQIPYDMHFRGAKHAKKIKAKQALTILQSQTESATITSEDDKKSFFCELCNVKANSSLQLRTHLDGSKHKSKLQPKEVSTESQNQEGSKDSGDASLNGKTNGTLVRSLPPDFGEPQPSKLTKFACDVCNVAVNSEIQLQQHLSSKKHQNKVEGRPITKGKRMKKDNDTTSLTDVAMETSVEQKSNETEKATSEAEKASNGAEPATNETSTKVVGVKTLASSFVQGETLQ